jgi:hypothetical protein
MLVHVEQLGPITLYRLAEAMVVDRATTSYTPRVACSRTGCLPAHRELGTAGTSLIWNGKFGERCWGPHA